MRVGNEGEMVAKEERVYVCVCFFCVHNQLFVHMGMEFYSHEALPYISIIQNFDFARIICIHVLSAKLLPPAHFYVTERTFP